jgi:imidazolonepropionase-like amidohydrolase
VAILLTGVAAAQSVPPNDTTPFINNHAPVIVLNHVRVIDGTGSAAKENQSIVIAEGKIQAAGDFGTVTIPANAEQQDRTGYTVIPGLVGMHNHLYYTNSFSSQISRQGGINEPGLSIIELPFSAPRLYLAAGVTTMRTTGSIEPYTDIKVKERIDSGLMPGPHIDLTGPYLEGKPTFFAQMHELTGVDDAKRMVDYWAEEGMTSYKAYMNITRAELGAAIQEAHARHLKLTGHLCSVTWREAIALGIDDFEHGPVFTDTEFAGDKKVDECKQGSKSWMTVEVGSAQVQGLIQDLVSHHVSVTSTLPVFEASMPGRPKLEQRVLDAMSPDTAQSYLISRAKVPMTTPLTTLFKKEMDFELAFAKAGGLLLAGPDPTGNGGVLPGFGDQREVELLVEAGFTPVEAIKVATLNGATYLGQQEHIGSIAPGKQADLVLIKGDPSKKIDDIENVDTVFKDGVGYDSQKLVESVRGQVGIH